MRAPALFALLSLACPSSKDAAPNDPPPEPASRPDEPAEPAEPPAPAEPAETPVADEATTAQLLEELAAAVDCSEGDGADPWCIAATGWAGGSAGPLPAEPTVLAGMSIELQQGEPVADALAQKVQLCAQAIKKVGPDTLTKKLSVLNADAGDVVASVRAKLSGERTSLAIPDELSSVFEPASAEVTHPLQKGDKGWTWKAGVFGELRRVGDHWVAVEVPTFGPPRIHLSVLTSQS